MASGPEGTELLKCQTTILKVSIHCEGCKKKVKKVLQGLEGVYAIDINSKQNKVTVTGSVDAESLIRKLLKHKKHAELWPEMKPTADSNTKISTITSPEPKTEHNLPNTETEQKTEESKNKTISTTSPTEAKETTNSDEVSLSKINIEAPPPENSDKKDGEKPATEEQVNLSEKADDLNKKGEKAQGETSKIAEREISNSNTPKGFAVCAQPVYTVSYSAVQPSTSYVYYTPPELVRSSFPTENPSENPSGNNLYYGSVETQAASGGSYDMFNEENPNACNLM